MPHCARSVVDLVTPPRARSQEIPAGLTSGEYQCQNAFGRSVLSLSGKTGPASPTAGPDPAGDARCSPQTRSLATAYSGPAPTPRSRPSESAPEPRAPSATTAATAPTTSTPGSRRRYPTSIGALDALLRPLLQRRWAHARRAAMPARSRTPRRTVRRIAGGLPRSLPAGRAPRCDGVLIP